MTLAPLPLRAALLAALLCCAAVPAVRAGTHTRPPGPPQPALLYHNYCSVCHGDQGDGRSRAQFSLHPAPRDFTSADQLSLPRARMLAAVRDGRPGTAMTAWKSQLNEAEMDALVDYVRASFMPAAPGAARPAGGAAHLDTAGLSGIQHGRRQAAPDAAAVAAPAATPANLGAAMPDGLRGQAAKGATFYMSNCATCHGSSGDGRGPRAYFINPKPRNFLTADARSQLNRAALFQAISAGKQGTEMPAWSKVLSAQEVADVTEFVFQRFIVAPAKPGGR